MVDLYIKHEDEDNHLPIDVEKTLVKKTSFLMEKLGVEKLTIFFCEVETIKNLNKDFRNQDKPTDILSFNNSSEIDNAGDIDESNFGELAVCLEICKKQALEYQLLFIEELMRLVVHGLVHITGKDHQNDEDEQVMLAQEIQLLDLIEFKDLY